MYHKRLVPLALIILLFAGCDQAKMSSELDPLNDVALQARMEADPAVQDLYSIFQEVGNRYIELDVSKEAFAKAYAAKTKETSVALLGYTEAEYDRLTERFNSNIESIRETYPELASSELRGQCEIPVDLDISQAYQASIASFKGGGLPLGKSSGINEAMQRPDCKWLAYTACLITATTLGPLLYWPAAYVCMCGFCDSSLCI